MVGFALETESAVKSSMGGPYQPSLKASDITKKIENFLILKSAKSTIANLLERAPNTKYFFTSFNLN